MRSRYLSTITSLLLLPMAVRATCYAVDGTKYTDASFVPCDSSSEYSACCASNKGSRSDICLSSGLCYAQDTDYRGLIYMNGCTDSSGYSSDCPSICPNQANNWNGGSKATSWNVLQCNKGEYCCRESGSTENCCGNSSAIVTTDIGTLLLATTTATTTSSTATGTPDTTASTSAAVTATSSSDAQETCSTNKTAVVGGAVGGALGAALLASLGALAFVMKRRKDSGYAAGDYRPTAQAPGAPSMASPSSGYTGQSAKPAHYYDGSSVPQNPQELPARSRYEMQ